MVYPIVFAVVRTAYPPSLWCKPRSNVAGFSFFIDKSTIQTLRQMKQTRPDIIPEFKEKVELLQNEHSLDQRERGRMDMRQGPEGLAISGIMNELATSAIAEVFAV
jgi:hypothetical protein